MPRAARILYDGAIYHIINRGHNRQRLFRESKDYIKFKDILRHYRKRYRFKLFHYCIMANHFHLIMKVTKGEELPLIMKGIAQKYVNYYKRKYHSVGYVFQSRYKSLIIEKDEYLLECARYIERNPLRANIVTNLAKYPWSSYNYYTKGIYDVIIDTQILYGIFGNTIEERQINYTRYISEPRPYETLLDNIIQKMK